jgi:hypothetical protein
MCFRLLILSSSILGHFTQFEKYRQMSYKMQKYDELLVFNKTGCLSRCSKVEYGSKLVSDTVYDYDIIGRTQEHQAC